MADQKTGSIYPIEPNAPLEYTSKGLEFIRDVLNQKYRKDLTPETRGHLGNFLLGQAPEELDKWAHGFDPFTIQPSQMRLSDVAAQGIRPDRQQGVLDVANVASMAAPVAGLRGLGQNAVRHAAVSMEQEPFHIPAFFEEHTVPEATPKEFVRAMNHIHDESSGYRNMNAHLRDLYEDPRFAPYRDYIYEDGHHDYAEQFMKPKDQKLTKDELAQANADRYPTYPDYAEYAESAHPKAGKHASPEEFLNAMGDAHNDADMHQQAHRMIHPEMSPEELNEVFGERVYDNLSDIHNDPRFAPYKDYIQLDGDRKFLRDNPHLASSTESAHPKADKHASPNEFVQTMQHMHDDAHFNSDIPNYLEDNLQALRTDPRFSQYRDYIEKNGHDAFVKDITQMLSDDAAAQYPNNQSKMLHKRGGAIERTTHNRKIL